MTDALLTLFPCVPYMLCHERLSQWSLHRAAPVYHLGIFREKVSLQPVECESSRSAHISRYLTVHSRLLKVAPCSHCRHCLRA